MVAVVVAGDATEAIPLLADNGSGVYNKGQNNITEFRREFLGGLVGPLGNTMWTWRPGILNPGQFNGAPPVPLDATVIQAGGGAGTQAVGIWGYRAIVVRNGVGPYLVSQDGNIASLAAPAADATNPRKDLLCIMPYDKGAFPADAQHGPKYIWVTGDPAASPSTPALPVAVADALILYQATRAANDNTIATADLLDMRKGAGIYGAQRVMFPGDLLTDAGGYHGELRFRQSGAGILAITPVAELVDRWSATDSKWHGTQTLPTFVPSQTGSGGLATGVTATLCTLSVPDMGFAYKVIASGSYEYTSTTANAFFKCQITANSAAMGTGVVARGSSKWPGTNGGESKVCEAIPVETGVTIAAGSAATFRMLAQNVSGGSDNVALGNEFGFQLNIVPV